MLKWLSRSATVLLMLFSAQSFAINAQDPYSLVKDAAGKIDVNADMSAITSEKTDAFYDGDASKWIKYANSLRLRYAMRLSAVDQAKDFWDFVNNDSYLKDRKGKYVERNGSLTPWINRFDFKIAQDFYATLGGRKYGIQVSLDMLNVGNMINSKWGAYQSCGLKSYDNVQLLKTASKVGEPLTYQINANSREAFKERSSWQYTNTIGSAWSMQLGVKVTF